VFVARHGQTEWNELGRRQGQFDSPLTSLGEQQAQLLARAVAELPGLDGIFSSPLQRALRTAALCSEALSLPVMVIEELAEVHHGVMAGLTASEVDERFPGEMNRRDHDKYRWRFPGGESYADADARAAGAIEEIACYGVRFPLIVSHEMIGRMLMRHLLGAAPAAVLAWKHPHDVIYKIDPAQRARTAIQVGTASTWTS
jgi:broad specificity phosphatase PhoE